MVSKELRSAQEASRANEQELRKARDELENKVAERTAELRRGEKELRDLLDSIPAIVWSALPDGSNSYANRRFVDHYGIPLEQIAGSGWHTTTCPDDLQRSEAICARPLQAANLIKARFVFAERIGDIAGIWTAARHCEMRMEISSNGMVS